MLLITSKLKIDYPGGRELLSVLNYKSLKKIYGKNLITYELEKIDQPSLYKAINGFKGYIDGSSKKIVAEVLDIIKNNNIENVFIDGSNLGVFAHSIKEKFPSIKITIFFHNVEVRFFYGALRAKNSLHALGVMVTNYFAEMKSVKFSDYRVVLNKRDSEQLKKIYGREATHISSIAMKDKFSDSYPNTSSKFSLKDSYALFVGGNFYANRDGITWFLENVAPKIDIKIVVIGRDLDVLKKKFFGVTNIEIIGEVDSVNDWYLGSKFVVAPIFDGSGMKTKISEAMMFGRKIIGSEEAFFGYEQFADVAGWICKSSDDYIDAINQANSTIIEPFHPELREIFKEHLSQDSYTLRLKKILK